MRKGSYLGSMSNHKLRTIISKLYQGIAKVRTRVGTDVVSVNDISYSMHGEGEGHNEAIPGDGGWTPVTWMDEKECPRCSNQLDWDQLEEAFCPKCGWSYEQYCCDHTAAWVGTFVGSRE
jgi:hypothetical protein